MISVCVATYNGEKYIEEQLDSILNNICSDDEIVVSDDGSNDNTLNILNEYRCKYPNIKIINGPKKGVVQNFQNAIYYAKGDFIFLSDQDDIWENNKVICVMDYLTTKGYSLIVHDASLIDGEGEKIEDSFFAIRKSKSGLIKNFIKNSYIGCCMAFTSEMKKYILPIPSNIEMHDWWIGLVSEIYGKTFFLEDKLIRYRRHGKNVSQMYHYPIYKMILNRIVLLIHLIGRVGENIK